MILLYMTSRSGGHHICRRPKQKDRTVSTKTFRMAKAERREAAPLKHLDLPDDLFDSEDPVQAAIDADDDGDPRPVGMDRGMTISAAFFEPLPDDLLAAFEGGDDTT